MSQVNLSSSKEVPRNYICCALQANHFMFVGPIIHSLSLKKFVIINNGAIVISGRKIVLVEENPNVETIKKRYEILDENVYILEKEQFLIPGFIDTHTHAPQYPNIGLGYDMTLLDWLNTYTYPLEKQFSDEALAERVYDSVVKRTVSNGTTTSCYFATLHKNSCVILAKSAKKFGQRAFIGKVNMVKNCPNDYCETEKESIENTKLFIKEIMDMKDNLINPIITPRFALSSTMELMKNLAQLAISYNIPIQTHVSENKDEIKQVAEMYPQCRNYVDVYDTAGLLTDKTILAHGVHLKPDEITVLRNRKTTIVHCPHSNLLLQSGVCPVRQLLDNGVRVSLGTDCSGGAYPSILYSIRHAITSSIFQQFNDRGEKLTHEEVFYLATLAGAEALSLDDVTGNFIVGKDFDAILVNMKDNPSTDFHRDYSTKELFEKFLYSGDDRSISKVYVAGRLIKPSKV